MNEEMNETIEETTEEVSEEVVEEVNEATEGVQVTDEQLDEIADTAIAALKDVLA